MSRLRAFTRIQDIRTFVRTAHQQAKSVAFVPTMGCLHEGHISLIHTARAQNDVVISSIFVNPLQFGPTEDLEAYPRDLDRDTKLLRENGCDVLFAPSVEEMYPRPMATQVALPSMSTQLCGKTRPTHFQGVATVVCKLFNIVQPDRAYFGQKDGQQVAVIRRMVEDLSIPVEIVTVPIVRESSGLAKSSRNVYLTGEDRMHATVLYQALTAGKALIDKGERDAHAVEAAMAAVIQCEPNVRLDYASAISLETLETPNVLVGPTMLAVAAFVGKARLIDNFQFTV